MLIYDLLATVGIVWDGSLYEGEPRGYFTDIDKAIISICLLLPEDATNFCQLDPDASQILGQLKALLSSEQLSSLKNYQHALARDQRRAAYSTESDGVYLEAVFDDSADAMNAWKLKVQQIKDRFPFWP